MPELDEYDVMDEISPAEAARTALQVADQMRQEEASLGPVVTAQQALNFVPQTRADLTRLPGQVFPPVDPARLASKVIGGPSPAVIPDPTAEMLDTARRFGVSPEVVIRAEQARRQYEAQQGIRADIDAGMPESAAIAKWSGGLFPNLRSTSGLFPRTATAQPTIHNIAGTGYVIDAQGNVKPVTPPPPARGISTEEWVIREQIKNAIKEGDTTSAARMANSIKQMREPVAAPAVAAPAAPRSFKTEKEALASGVKGIVLINGRRARIE